MRAIFAICPTGLLSIKITPWILLTYLVYRILVSILRGQSFKLIILIDFYAIPFMSIFFFLLPYIVDRNKAFIDAVRTVCWECRSPLCLTVPSPIQQVITAYEGNMES
jgi:hypothetical protein